MLNWLKLNIKTIVIYSIIVGFLAFLYSCEPRVRSLNNSKHWVNRAEFQVELDTILALAEVRFIDFERQERLRTFILQNGLILIQGQPLNPVGILTAIAGIYGVTQAGKNVTKTVKEHRKKKKTNNGAG